MHDSGDGRLVLTSADLPPLATGAAFLGCGGGGDPYIGRLLLGKEMSSGRRPRIIDADHLDDNALVAMLGGGGAPIVALEKAPNVDALVSAARELERHLGRKLDAVLPGESGGLNATLPIVAALRMDLPIIDADGMGRAFPELHMVTFSIYGCSAAPVVLVDDHGSKVTIQTHDNRRLERLARSVIVGMGGMAMGALYPMSGRQIKQTAVRRTLSMALEIGRALHAARRRSADPVCALVDCLNQREPDQRFAAVLLDGKVQDVKRETGDGFVRGRAFLAGLEDGDRRCEIIFQNEYPVVRCGRHCLAVVPDLITILDRETAEPITTEGLKYGQRVKVVGVSAAPILHTPQALATVGPRAFGIDMDFRPLEELNAA